MVAPPEVHPMGGYDGLSRAGEDSMGLLNEVTQVISRQLNVNIRKLTIETEDGIFEGKIQLWVHDVDDVKTICNNLKKIQNIKQVSRVEE